MNKILPAGRFLLAAPMLIYPFYHYVYPSAVAGIIPPWIPWHLFWNYFTAITLQLAGLAIVIQKQVRLAAGLLGLEILLFTLNIHSFLLFPIPGVQWGLGEQFGTYGGRLNNCFKEVGMTGAAFMLAGMQSASWKMQGKDWLFTTGRIIFGISITAFGLLHFLYPAFAPGVPPMFENVGFIIPGKPLWAYLTGAAFLLGGICILLDKQVRKVAAWLGILIVVFDVLVWAPRFAQDPGELGGNWLKDIGIAGGALILGQAMLYVRPKPAAVREEKVALA
jgi:uncharacterized membrane protein YphA (DoxX/SURF4 family)